MTNSRDVSRHLITHKNRTDEDKFKCNVCNKFYSSTATLLLHMNQHNENGYNHICEQCGTTCPTLAALIVSKILS
jgi:transcription elongation factor Elf1